MLKLGTERPQKTLTVYLLGTTETKSQASQSGVWTIELTLPSDLIALKLLPLSLQRMKLLLFYTLNVFFKKMTTESPETVEHSITASNFHNRMQWQTSPRVRQSIPPPLSKREFYAVDIITPSFILLFLKAVSYLVFFAVEKRKLRIWELASPTESFPLHHTSHEVCFLRIGILRGKQPSGSHRHPFPGCSAGLQLEPTSLQICESYEASAS